MVVHTFFTSSYKGVCFHSYRSAPTGAAYASPPTAVPVSAVRHVPSFAPMNLPLRDGAWYDSNSSAEGEGQNKLK